MADALTFLGGDTLTTLRPNAFSMRFTLKGAAIPSMFGTPPAAPFSFAFFASHDAVLSGEDVRLTYSLTESTAGDLQKGIAANSTVTLLDVTSGLQSIFTLVLNVIYSTPVLSDVYSSI